MAYTNDTKPEYYNTYSVTNFPGTVANDTSIGSIAWTASQLTRVKVDDNLGCEDEGGMSAATNYLKCTNFGFSLPTGAIITGIVINLKAQRLAGSNCTWTSVKLVKGGTIQTTAKQSSAGAITGSYSYTTVGDSTSLWSDTWTVSDINGSGFGVAASLTASSFWTIHKCDCISITVYYKVYSWTDDTIGSGSYTNDAEPSAGSYTNDAIGSGSWSNDAKGSGSYTNDSK